MQHSRADPSDGGVDKEAPEGVTMGELAQSLVCCAVTGEEEMLTAFPTATYGRQEGCPCPSLAAAFRRVASTVELTLMAGAQVSQPEGVSMRKLTP